MCNFWSAIVTKSGDVLFNEMDDSHESIIELYKNKYDLKDETTDPDRLKFARIEIAPPDNDVFKPLNEWVFKIDQSIKPTWLTKTDEKNARKTLSVFAKKAIINGKSIDKLDDGRYWIKDCKIDLLCNKVFVVALWGTSRVGEMRGTSQVGTMRGTSQVGTMRETSRVGTMLGTSQVGTMWETSQVGTMLETSLVGTMWGTSRVGTMWGTSQVGTMRETSTAFIPDNEKYRIICADMDKFILEKHKTETKE
jgi:hypothetical protein